MLEADRSPYRDPEILRTYRNALRRLRLMSGEPEWIDDAANFRAWRDRYDALSTLAAGLRCTWIAWNR